MAAYPEGLLVPGERVLVHLRPHWRMLVLPVVVPPPVVGLGAFLAARVAAAPWHAPAQIAILVVAALLVGWFSVAPVLRWRCTHFVVTDRRVLVREGVLSRTGIAVAGATVTGVTARQTLPERLLRCGTLVVAVEYSEDPWEFDGIADLRRTAVVLEQVAAEQGGERDDAEGGRHAHEPEPVGRASRGRPTGRRAGHAPGRAGSGARGTVSGPAASEQVWGSMD